MKEFSPVIRTWFGSTGGIGVVSHERFVCAIAPGAVQSAGSRSRRRYGGSLLGASGERRATMAPRGLFLVRMDVAHDHEARFNEVYDKEHVPLLRAVPGVIRASRYRQPSPTEPRYLAAYELESLAVLQSPEWKAAGEAGRWPTEIRPHTMNRHLAAYEWVGSSPGLGYRTPYVFWVMMDIEPHREALFNELYDVEHVPLLLKLPGCVNVARYRTATPGEPRYLAAYEVERTDLPMSKLWNDTSDIGRWKPEVRPYTYNKKYIVSERL
jgi:hypothetical protein